MEKAWKGLAFKITERCEILETDDGYRVKSEIAGDSEQAQLHITYAFSTDKNWCFQRFSGLRKSKEGTFRISLERSENGIWAKNGIPIPEFDGWMDIDIWPSPITNSLPVKRLRLETGQKANISVLYIDMIKGEIRIDEQSYERLSAKKYQFRSGDFLADIRFDNDDFVEDYPGLFRKI